MATSRRVGNYATSAKAVTQASDQIFDAAMSNKPDFTAISKEAIKGRSLERRAVTEAEGRVAQAGLEAFTKAKRTKNDVESAKRINDIKRPAKRMAGIVAGLGALTTGYVTMEENKKTKAENEQLRAERDAIYQKQENRWAESDKRYEQMMSEWRSSAKDSTTPPSSTTTPSSGGTTPPSSSTKPIKPSSTVSSDISAQHSFDPGKKMTKAQIKQLAQSVGFNPEAAGIVVGIAGGESGYDPTNSTRRSGLYAKTGEDSVGLMQINWGYHKDSGWLQKLGITKREDLFDPVNNMKAAKYLYDGRKGGFGDWTVYNKNIYKDYL